MDHTGDNAPDFKLDVRGDFDWLKGGIFGEEKQFGVASTNAFNSQFAIENRNDDFVVGRLQ